MANYIQPQSVGIVNQTVPTKNSLIPTDASALPTVSQPQMSRAELANGLGKSAPIVSNTIIQPKLDSLEKGKDQFLNMDTSSRIPLSGNELAAVQKLQAENNFRAGFNSRVQPFA